MNQDDVRVKLEVLPLDRPPGESWALRYRVLLEQIERVLPEGGGWCTLEKAHTLAALIVGLRATTVVEIGVWLGGSFLPMAMTLKALGKGQIIGIDPWSPQASVQGQHGANEEWWSKVDHEAAYLKFMERLELAEVASISKIYRMTSDQASRPSTTIDLLHIDGNHGPAVMADVHKFVPLVRCGGIVFMDDIGWEGGDVARACDLMRQVFGFEELYKLDTGAVFQRVR